MKSKLFSVKFKDVAKSVTLFIITSIGSAIYAYANKNGLPESLPEIVSIAKPALLASGGYIIKQFFTNSKDGFLKKEIIENK